MVRKIDAITNNTVVVKNKAVSQTQKQDEALLQMKSNEIKPFEVEHEKDMEQKAAESVKKSDDADEVYEQEQEMDDVDSVDNESNNPQNSVSITNESYTDTQKLTRQTNTISGHGQVSALYEFVDAMEDESGDKINEFLVQKYPSGTHFAGETSALYENCNDDGKTMSYTGNAFFLNTNSKGGTFVAGGAFEYKASNTGEEKSAEKNGNAVLGYRHGFGKTENENVSKYTGAVLASGSFNEGAKQFTGSIGFEHNPTGFAASYKIQSLTLSGETTLKRNFSFTFLDNDKSDEINAEKLAKQETPEQEVSEREELPMLSDEIRSEASENPETKWGKYLARNKAAGYGFGVKFVMQNAEALIDDDINEYGLVANYSFSFLNNGKKNPPKNFVITPSLGVLDANKSVKLTSGIEADYKSTSVNDTQLQLNASVNNSTSFALKNKPINTFSASFTGSLNSKKITASANASYIKSNQDMKSSSVSVAVEYRITDNITATAQTGFTEYKLFDEIQNKCVQLGIGAKINF